MYVTVEQNLEAVLYFASSECVAGSYWARQLCIISLEPHNHWPWLSTALYIFTAPSQLCFSSASPSSNCMSNQCSSVQPSTKTWARCRSMCFIWFPFTLLQPLYQHTFCASIQSHILLLPLVPGSCLHLLLLFLFFSYAMLPQHFCLLGPVPGDGRTHRSISAVSISLCPSTN